LPALIHIDPFAIATDPDAQRNVLELSAHGLESVELQLAAGVNRVVDKQRLHEGLQATDTPATDCDFV